MVTISQETAILTQKENIVSTTFHLNGQLDRIRNLLDSIESWNAWLTFINKWYLPNATTVRMIINDPDDTGDKYLADFTVYDAKNQPLEPDFPASDSEQEFLQDQTSIPIPPFDERLWHRHQPPSTTALRVEFDVLMDHLATAEEKLPGYDKLPGTA